MSEPARPAHIRLARITGLATCLDCGTVHSYDVGVDELERTFELRCRCGGWLEADHDWIHPVLEMTEGSAGPDTKED